MKKLLLLLFIVVITNNFLQAQLLSKAAGQNKFAIFGNAEFSYKSNHDQKNFGDVNFKPIFLWKINNNLFVESEIEIETGEGSVDLGLEYANLCYSVNPYLVLHAGRFLPKFGAYRGRFAEGFLNRFATDPAGFGDGGIGASVETGVGALGSLPFGSMQIMYDLYVVNGPQLLTDTANAGQFDYEAYSANNNDKAYGGRLGLLPLPDASLELGFSYQHKSKTGSIDTPDENVSLDMQAVDLNYFTNIAPLKSTIRLTGEYRHQKVGNNALYQKSNGDVYGFSNAPSAFYISGSFRPALLASPFMNKLELAGRYSYFKRPADAPWGGSNVPSTELALDYWLHWNSLLKLSYQNRIDLPNSFYVQAVVGF